MREPTNKFGWINEKAGNISESVSVRKRGREEGRFTSPAAKKHGELKKKTEKKQYARRQRHEVRKIPVGGICLWKSS